LKRLSLGFSRKGALAGIDLLTFFLISSETPPAWAGLVSQHDNMPAGRRPEHAPSSAAGTGCFYRTGELACSATPLISFSIL
jgi:hypothetical protein